MPVVCIPFHSIPLVLLLSILILFAVFLLCLLVYYFFTTVFRDFKRILFMSFTSSSYCCCSTSLISMHTSSLSLPLTYSYCFLKFAYILYTLPACTTTTPLQHTTITASSVCLFEWDLLPLSLCVCYYCYYYYYYYSVVFHVLFAAHSIFNDFFVFSFVCHSLLPLLRCDSCSAHCPLNFSTLYVLLSLLPCFTLATHINSH